MRDAMDREREHFALNRWWWKQNAKKAIWICVPVCRRCRFDMYIWEPATTEKDRRTRRRVKKHNTIIVFVFYEFNYKFRVGISFLFLPRVSQKNDLKRIQRQVQKSKQTENEKEMRHEREHSPWDSSSVLLSKRNFSVCFVWWMRARGARTRNKIVNGYHRWIYFAKLCLVWALNVARDKSWCASVRMRERARTQQLFGSQVQAHICSLIRERAKT